MCGIVGYVGNKKVLPILIETLKTLEYRGYDSSGIAYVNDNKIKIIKDIGMINQLESKIDTNEDSFVGIGHTRWATHGGVTINNAHPHRQGKVTLVHNGIIENYLEIKEKLLNYGYVFNSDTDSEVLAALIDYLYKSEDNIVRVLTNVTKELKGSYEYEKVAFSDAYPVHDVRTGLHRHG